MRSIGIAVCIGLMASSAAWAQKIEVDFDHQADFAKYKTFAYVKTKPVQNELMDQRIQEAIKNELRQKGLTESQSNPSMVVTYTAAEKENTTYMTDSWGYGGGWRFGGGMGTSTTNSFTSVKGTVVVDMYDAGNKQMLFRGSASETVSDKPEKNAEKINKGMKKLFEKFPPKE